MSEAGAHEMKEYFRCVEYQSKQALRGLVDTDEEFIFLEEFVEDSKPDYPEKTDSTYKGYHYLIQTPFRYPLPVEPQYQARFRPPFYYRNVFYCSEKIITALSEASFYFLRERVHISQKVSQQAGPRTLFKCHLDLKSEKLLDIRSHPEINKIMDRQNLTYSHNIINDNKDTEVLLYPSCRCLDKGTNAAVYIISRLGPDPVDFQNYDFIFNQKKSSVMIKRQTYPETVLNLTWDQVT